MFKRVIPTVSFVLASSFLFSNLDEDLNNKSFSIPSSSFFSLPSSLICHAEGNPPPISRSIINQPSFSATNTPQKNLNSKIKKKKNPTLDNLCIISGSAHPQLAKDVSEIMGVPLCNRSLSRFSDGEVNLTIDEDIRGHDVFIIQPCAAPVNDSIMELLLTIACAKRANAKRVIAVIPYYGYKHHRRERKFSNKKNSSFLSTNPGDFAQMLQEVGVDHIISVDLQRPGQGSEACFFDNSIPVETLISNNLFIERLAREKLKERINIVAPNAECFKKAKKFQEKLLKYYSDVNLVEYFTNENNEAIRINQVKPDLRGGDVIIVDDMIDTGHTFAYLSKELLQNGANNIYLCASHGLLSGKNAYDTLKNAGVKKVFVTDSLPLPPHIISKNTDGMIEQISVASYLANVIVSEHLKSHNFKQEEEFTADD